MIDFSFSRADSVEHALAEAAAHPGAAFIAGGTNLVDLLKVDVARPPHLIDITRLKLDAITESADGVRIGALVSNADLAWHPLIRERYPLLAQALLAGASPQLRNMATTGGNLLQRTRCYYFYDVATPCNKRSPGSGCPALHGQNRIHAILGASEHCIAVHPSDMCVALRALDAVVVVQTRAGEQRIPIADFHRLPGDTPERDNNLEPGALITAVELPPEQLRGHYLKLRDRASYAFALVSVAVGLQLDGDVVRDARIALGGVAHKPWRKREAEQLLIGKTREAFPRAAELLLEGAQPRALNAFKIELAKRAIVRALETACA
ncbi:MAG TPA: xanthine dehydrogenase family protein subunit M [Polyangiales bacterium]|nr:xanthine dehydrogenase family protein subunit M [Polyangiales bacterium]